MTATRNLEVTHRVDSNVAMVRDNVKVVEEVTRGADVHIRGEQKLTPFQVAKRNGHHEIARLLLEHGAEEGVASI